MPSFHIRKLKQSQRKAQSYTANTIMLPHSHRFVNFLAVVEILKISRSMFLQAAVHLLRNSMQHRRKFDGASASIYRFPSIFLGRPAPVFITPGIVFPRQPVQNRRALRVAGSPLNLRSILCLYLQGSSLKMLHRLFHSCLNAPKVLCIRSNR